MKVQLRYDKKKLIWIGAMAVVALALLIWSHYPIAAFPGFVAVFALICGLDIKMTDATPFWWKKLEESSLGKKLKFPAKMTVTYSNMLSWIVTAVLMYVGPWFSVWCMQHIILEAELYAKTGKTAFRMNVLCVSVLYIAMLAVFARARWAFIVSHTLILILAFADYFVYEFRQNEIVFADLDTIRTGLSVATTYRFIMSSRGALLILCTLLAFALVIKFKFRFRHPILIRIALLAAVYFMIPYTWGKIRGRVTQTWEKKGTYRNGFIVNFILGIRDSQVSEPAGYSEEVIRELETQYALPADTDTAQSAASETKPTIITIMNESFADFRLIGDLQTNVEVTPFLDSLTENTLRGFAMSSVFGAKTPNSEWEYLSGHSMAFMPGGSVVYQQFLGDKPSTLVSTLKNEGYTTVAMHPYFAAGWRRNTVYPRMGFDEMYFMDDGYFDDTKLIREYISDQEMFDKLIARYEQKQPGEPLFFLGVTMQNHGGYKDVYENFTPDVSPLGDGRYYLDASQYLSLIHQTDKAMENLIGYFSQVDEPVEIIFFGDHYPSLDSGFIRTLNDKGVSGLTLSELEQLFSVPFFIWTNYDTPEESDMTTSLNYLSTLTLERSGLEIPPYNRFLQDLMKVVPSINIRGYYSLAAGKYQHISDATGAEKDWLRKYRILQYNSMFDEKGRSEVFFPYIEEASAQ